MGLRAKAWGRGAGGWGLGARAGGCWGLGRGGGGAWERGLGAWERGLGGGAGWAGFLVAPLSLDDVALCHPGTALVCGWGYDMCVLRYLGRLEWEMKYRRWGEKGDVGGGGGEGGGGGGDVCVEPFIS